MTFEEKLAAMQNAKAIVDLAFMEALVPLRDEYVLVGQQHVEAETAWMNNPADEDLQAAAASTWATVTAARADLLAAVATANDARQASLDEAWAAISADQSWPPLQIAGNAGGDAGASGEISTE